MFAYSSIIKPVGIVFTALCLIVCGDAAGKMLTSSGVSPFFVAWSRFGIAAILLLPIFGMRLRDLRLTLDWRILLRASFIVGGVCCILTALRTEPMANVFGAFFVGPVISYFLAALVLKEKIAPARTILLLLGFLGVMLVVKPGFGATQGIAFALAAGCLHGAYLVATRWLAGQYKPTFLLISQLLAGAFALLPLGLSTTPPVMSMRDIFLVCSSAIASAAGNYLLVVANKTTPASLIAPLIYTQLIAATAVGYVVFSDWPTTMTLIGLTIVLSSGLLSLWFAQRAK